jgi:hypothetical protein
MLKDLPIDATSRQIEIMLSQIIGTVKKGSTVNIVNGFYPIMTKSMMHRIVMPVRIIIVLLACIILFLLFTFELLGFVCS